MLGDKYKIEVSYPGAGLSEAKPLNSSFDWTFEREPNQIYFRKKLSTPLNFIDDPTQTNGEFSKLYAIERSRNSRCDKVDVIISKRCSPSGAFAQHYQGYLAMIDGKWNKSNCEVEIPIRPQDQYACLYENWEKDINILQLPGLEKYDSRSTIGSIEYRECSRTTFTERYHSPFIGVSDCLGVTSGGEFYIFAKGWTLVKHRVELFNKVYTTWAREVFIGAKPGPDWIDDGGGRWVRSIVPDEDFSQYIDDGIIFQRVWKIVQYNLSNGIKLSNLLPEMIKTMLPCQYTLISNFLGINPDSTAPTNQAYDKAFDHVRQVYVYDKSDVRRALDKDQNAFGVKNQISIKKLIDNLKALWNVAFEINESTPNIIRLEHVSYFKERKMLDLTKPAFLDDIKGKWKYTYEKSQLPIRENFEFMEPQTPFMDGTPIVYNYACSNDNKSNNETTVKADSVSTDVDDIVYHPDKYSDKGFVFVERAEEGYIVSGTGYGQSVVRNGNLSWTSLQDPYYKWGRPQRSGIMNGQETRFNSFQRTRKQESIQIHLCCADFEQFDPLDLVRTQLGWGEIVSAKYAEPEEILTLELIHD